MFEELIVRIVRSLAEQRIDYMLIGGQAVLIHGEPRLTRDIDLTLNVDPSELNRVKLAADGAKLQALVTDDDFVATTFVFPCIEPESGIRVDFILSFSDYERQAIEHAHVVDICGEKVRVASPEDLIVQKCVAGRARDVDDARSVLAKVTEIDREYIERWLADFDGLVEGHSPLAVFRNLET